MVTIAERMMKIETQVEDICNGLSEHKSEQKEDTTKILNKLDELDSKFAGKWVENVTVAAAGTLIVILIGIIIQLVI